MYFNKRKQKTLSKELFKNPTAEYRGAPFWAWNSKLEKEELARQIDIFKQMGFGGFNMHVRQGLETTYLGEDYMDAIRFCAEKAQKEGMTAWLYDEDRWPSGVAGGFVTKNPKYRQKNIKMCFADKLDCATSKEQARETGKPFFLCAFSVEIGKDGKMLSYKKVDRHAKCDGKRYFFLEQRQGGEPRYNYQSYVDTMDKDAIDEFIKVTHEAFKNSVGDLFGKSIPSIFTDEPQLYGSLTARSGFHKNDIGFSWTTDFDDTYKAEYGEDILDYLPELFYTTDDVHAYKTRFNYYTHVSSRFCSAFIDNIAKWCEDNGLPLSGHMLGEDALWETMLDNGDNMRCYKNMQMPGIDILCDDVVFNTPIQCRSVCRQYGKDAMLAELYGVTGWDFDFRGHKYQGDWLACLGVNVRVQHLAWQSMKGEGKRDYPAPISYQSPWHLEYKYLEDHYARINTALTRGVDDVKIGVIYPVDTFKMIYGSMAESKEIIDEIDGNYKQTTEWLLKNGYDFDLISETLLPDLCEKGTNPLKVGKMQYEVIIASDCMTLRPHTVSVLNDFACNGGNLIIMGRKPEFVNAVKSDKPLALLEKAKVIPRSQSLLLDAIGKGYNVNIRYATQNTVESIMGKQVKVWGNPTTNIYKPNNLMCTARIDGDDKWLFFARTCKPQLPHQITPESLIFTVDGSYSVTLYDTLSGDVRPMSYKTDGKTTEFYATLYDLDSLLVKLSPVNAPSEYLEEAISDEYCELFIPQTCEYSLKEPNVLLLDMARYSVNGGAWQGPEEIMRIDSAVRTELGLDLRKFKVVQPWAVPNAPENNVVKLEYVINSKIDVQNVLLALEHPNNTKITLNGVAIDNTPVGYYVDKEIKTVKVGLIKKGQNILVLEMTFGLRTDLESCYLLGDFGTQVIGDHVEIISRPEKLSFSDVSTQGLTFYGGNIEYFTQIELDKESDVKIQIPHYRGALVGVSVDGIDQGRIAFSPFELDIKNLPKGKHELTFTLFGTRYNTFSALHNLNADKKRIYIGPDYWRSEGSAWDYGYHMRPLGILTKPTIKIKRK